MHQTQKKTMKSRSSRAAKAREFTPAERNKIFLRDAGQCIFCRKNYHMEDATWLGKEILSIMHYVPRSKNGLGIAENGALGCQYHHEMMDNGKDDRRDEMLQIFREYLQSMYPNWDEDMLTYSKWR